MRKVSGRVFACGPPLVAVALAGVCGSTNVGAATGVDLGVAPKDVAPLPHCTSNYQSVWPPTPISSSGGVALGSVDLLYDACTRTVKAQVNHNMQLGDVAEAYVETPSGTIVGDGCMVTNVGTGCTTGPIDDSGSTHKAYGWIAGNGGTITGDAATGAY